MAAARAFFGKAGLSVGRNISSTRKGARYSASSESHVTMLADFRHLTPAETGTRLRHLQGELAAQPHADIILDDLNGLDDPAVQNALARLLGSLRRRDATALVTTYRAPTNTTLHAILPNAAKPVDVPYLDEDEVADLVLQAGGDVKYAGSVYRATAAGHPQLVMAALLHLRSSDWSRRSIASVLGGQLQSELGEERRAVRERLVAALPEESQTLLLRTSLVRGGFDRSLAIKIASLLPTLAKGGLVLDQLVGPWIEPFRHGRMRVSPLLEDAAEEVLSEPELRAVHRCVAESLLTTEIDAQDASAAMHHALRSGRTELVIAFAGIHQRPSPVPAIILARSDLPRPVAPTANAAPHSRPARSSAATNASLEARIVGSGSSSAGARSVFRAIPVPAEFG